MPGISNKNKRSLQQLISNFTRQQNILIKLCVFPNQFSILFEDYLADSNNQQVAQIVCERVSQLYHFQIRCIWSIELFSHSQLMQAFLLAQQEHLFEGIFNHVCWQSIIEHEDPFGVSCVLVKLKQANLLFEKNIQLLNQHLQPSYIINILHFLNHFQIMNQENLEMVFLQPEPIHLFKCITLLIKNSIINKENAEHIFLKLYQMNYLNEFSETLNIMARCKILSPAYFTMLLNHPHAETLGYALSILRSNGILYGISAKSNFLKLYFHQYPVEFIYSLHCMFAADLIDEENAQRLFDHFSKYQQILFSNRHLWLQTDETLLRAQHIRNLISICIQFEDEPIRGRDMVEHYLQQFLIEKSDIQIFNSAQSTHTTSIHQSVSASAILLKNTYPNFLDPEEMDNILFDIKDYALELPTQKNFLAIKSCIFRLCSPSTQFIDPKSNLTLQQLIVLFWVAIHDKKKRVCSLADGLLAFTEALYEIQREYNLDELGNDLGGDDQPACLSGSFNKLIEKLQGRYPGIELVFISKYSASQKLKILCIEEIEQYITHQRTLYNDNEFSQLILELSTHGIEQIWGNISPNIKNKFFAEFSALFNHDINDTELNEMILLAKDINFDWQQFSQTNTSEQRLQ
jgi:hypothetical protein